MYEDKTYAAVLADAQAEVDSDVLKTEGSLTFNALSALAFEIEKLYTHMGYIYDQMHADTADFDGLVRLCADRGITSNAATSAQVSVTVVSGESETLIGKRFSLQGFNYAISSITSATEEAGIYTVVAIATVEEPGSGPNELTGALTPIDYIEGFVSATVTEVLVDGEDAETQAELYKRYLASFGAEGFGGNIADYRANVNAIHGVGGCKVYPVWNGPGTVKIAVISASYDAVSSYLLAQLEAAADPTGDHDGYGFASIDHNVTFVSAAETPLTIVVNLTAESGASTAAITAEVKAAINAYLLDLREEWAESEYKDQTVVYISRIMATALGVPGVADVSSVTVNGSDANKVLAWDEIPTAGTITLNFS